jgi:hypothetical protein
MRELRASWPIASTTRTAYSRVFLISTAQVTMARSLAKPRCCVRETACRSEPGSARQTSGKASLGLKKALALTRGQQRRGARSAAALLQRGVESLLPADVVDGPDDSRFVSPGET